MKHTIDLPIAARDAIRAWGFADAECRRLDTMTGESGIVVRHIGTTVSSAYYNGDRTLRYVYQVVSRRTSAAQAMEEVATIAYMMEHMPLNSSNGSFRCIDQEIYTEPHEIAVDDSGYHVWAVGFVAEIVPNSR